MKVPRHEVLQEAARLLLRTFEDYELALERQGTPGLGWPVCGEILTPDYSVIITIRDGWQRNRSAPEEKHED